MTQHFTIQAKAVEKIINSAVTRGADAKTLYESVSLNPAVLLDPDNRISFAQLVALYENAARITGDHYFGLHVGQTVNPTAFDVVGYSALNSSTLGEAFTRVARYHSIWTDGATFTLERSETAAAIIYRYLDESILEHRQDAEMTFATFVTLCRSVADPGWTPLSIDFQHETPADIAQLEGLFNCQINFGCPLNRLCFDSLTLELPIARADPRLSQVLDRHAEELLTRFPPRDSVVENVRSIIGRELNGGDPSLEFVAQQLSLSPRTLQRKLQELGTSHNDLLDQLRHELAIRYLREREMAICEVAYLLGFSEPSSFHRAFKRWTGVTPREFRN